MKIAASGDLHRNGSRTWLLIATTILSLPGMAVGVASTYFHYWYWAHGTNRSWGGGTIGRSVQLILLLNLGLWTALPATFCSLALWVSSKATLRAKIVGSIVIILAWTGESMFFIWHDPH